VAELTRQIAKMKTPEPEFYRVLGQALLSAGKPGEALKTYEQALRVQPGEPGTLLALAGAWSASGQTGRAREYLTLALKAAPLSAVAWAQAGLLDSAAGRDADSIRDFRNAVAIDPDYISCWIALGRALSRTGSNGEAETTLRHALQMDPYDATANDMLGRLLAGKGESNEALFDFRKATELRPKFAPHLYDYALELAAVSRNDESEMATRAALGEDRDMAEAHELLGRLMAGKKKLAEAEREYLETIRLKPELARAHLDLARVLAAEGKEDAAIGELRLAAEGKDPQVASLAADALRRLGR
jgi:tetratricopeptide (TPR) repeat protein